MRDSIVDEIKILREQYAEKFNNDSRQILQDLRAKQEELKKQGWKIASGRPRVYKREAA